MQWTRRNTQGLCLITSSPLPSILWIRPNSCKTTLGRVQSSIAEATLRQVASGYNPSLRDTCNSGCLESSCSPEAPLCLGAVGLDFHKESLHAPGVWGTHEASKSHSRSIWAHMASHMLPAPSATPNSSPGALAFSGFRDVTPAHDTMAQEK